MMKKQLTLDQIDIHGGTQARVETNNEAIASYAEEMAAGVEFPPVVVFFDGTKYWLADGFHRYLAARRVQKFQIQAQVQEGGRVEALRYALGANATNGLYRSNADKARAVELALTEWPDLSNSLLSEICKVSQDMIRRVRLVLTENNTIAPRETVTGKDGKEYPARIERQPRSERDEPKEGMVAGGGKKFEPLPGGGNTELEAEARAMVRRGEMGFQQLDAIPSVTAIDYAETAIQILERIKRDDPLRPKALERVARWLEKVRITS